MTKKKRATGAGGARIIRGHVLSDLAKETLAALAGYDLSNAEHAAYLVPHFGRIQAALGFYPAAVELLDHPQTAAEYVQDSKRFRELGRALLEAIASSTQWTRDWIESSGFEISDFELQIGEFLAAAGEMAEVFEPQKRRGNTTNNAIRDVAQRVHGVFGRIYIGDKSPGEGRGAFVKASPMEKAGLEFVRTALRDARIPVPQRLTRIIDDPFH